MKRMAPSGGKSFEYETVFSFFLSFSAFRRCEFIWSHDLSSLLGSDLGRAARFSFWQAKGGGGEGRKISRIKRRVKWRNALKGEQLFPSSSQQGVGVETFRLTLPSLDFKPLKKSLCFHANVHSSTAFQPPFISQFYGRIFPWASFSGEGLKTMAKMFRDKNGKKFWWYCRVSTFFNWIGK